MGLRNGLRRMFASIGREMKEKLPGTVSQIAQQTLEAMPVWDQGWAWRAQRNITVPAVKLAVAENTAMDGQLGDVKHLLTSLNSHTESAAKSNAETAEMLKRRLDEKGNREARADEKPESENSAKFYHFAQDGRPIEVKSKSEWMPDMTGLYEHRRLIGVSSAGYHGGFETSYGGGDGRVRWTVAHSNADEAGRAIDGLIDLNDTHQKDLDNALSQAGDAIKQAKANHVKQTSDTQSAQATPMPNINRGRGRSL
jgi:hypothetical protein